LHCDQYANLNQKVCLLQFISLDLELFYTNQTQFTYTIKPKDLQDCEVDLRERLEKTTENYGVQNFEAKHQIFFINFKTAENGIKKLTFNTETMKFQWEEENVDLDNVEIITEDQHPRLIVGDAYNTDNNLVHRFLIRKIQLLSRGCLSENGLFYFFHLIHGPKVIARGEIDLNTPDRVTISTMIGFTFNILKYQIAKSSLTVYEKYNLMLTLEDQEKNEYNLFVRIPDEQCLSKAFKLLSPHSVNCPKEAPTSLIYFKGVNLQDGTDDVSEDIKGLNFKAEEGIIEERQGNALSLKKVIKEINVYDIELKRNSESGEGWVYIKGVDSKSQIINKKYLLMIFDNQRHCLERLRNLEEEMFRKFAKYGKVFLWQVDKVNGADIIVNQNAVELENFKPLAVIDIIGNRIVKHGEVDKNEFKQLSLNTNERGLEVILYNYHNLSYQNLNLRCFERLQGLLFPVAPVYVANYHKVLTKKSPETKKKPPKRHVKVEKPNSTKESKLNNETNKPSSSSGVGGKQRILPRVLRKNIKNPYLNGFEKYEAFVEE
jgi:hypothetical protein